MKSFKSLLVSLVAVISPLLVHAAPSGALINPSADANTRALMSLLLKNYGSRSLSGQSEVSFSDWIQQNIGKTPAITGFDFMDYSPSRTAFGSSSTDVEKAIAWANRGGIVTFCWHWGSPNGAFNSAAQPWYSNFYTAATGFDIAATLNSPGSTNYNLLIRDIDAVSALLKRLQSAGVPVLWRPLHEAGGTWFWWGAKGPDACKKLWALMYDRMTNYHKLNNLIWVWNWEDPKWYPGNNAVDIVSTDIYAPAGNHDPQSAAFNRLKSLCGDSKLIAMGENGVIPNFSTAAPWSFWMTWNGAFITDGVSNSRSFLTSIFNSQTLLTLDEIQGWKSGGGTNPPKTTTTTRAVTVTTTRPTTTAGTGQPGGAPLYGQCGGQGWTGPTKCAVGTCTTSNQFYSQCL